MRIHAEAFEIFSFTPTSTGIWQMDSKNMLSTDLALMAATCSSFGSMCLLFYERSFNICWTENLNASLASSICILIPIFDLCATNQSNYKYCSPFTGEWSLVKIHVYVIFGIDYRWFLFSPLPPHFSQIICSPKACSFCLPRKGRETVATQCLYMFIYISTTLFPQLNTFNVLLYFSDGPDNDG